MAGLVLLLAACLAARSEAQPRPNFVVVLVDDLRWDALDVAGHPFVQSPNIDQLARQGIRFENAFVTTPLCSPARASFLTGRYARAHGIRTNGDFGGLDHDLETFPAALERAGYDTAFIGKWHMGEDDRPRPGFTHWVGFRGQGVYRNPELNINGRREKQRGYLTDLLNFYADDFVRTAARGSRPFLLYLSHKAVHAPFVAPPRHEGIYTGRRVECSPGCGDTLEGKPALTRDVPGTIPPERGDGTTSEDIRRQLALLSSVDEGLGQLVDTLQREGVLERTVVVFTSDNGFFYREHSLGDKRWPYEEAIRIPFILRYPPLVASGARSDALVLNVDLAPTLLELSGLAIPEDVQGRSLVTLLRGEREGWRSSFATEYFEEAPFPRIPTWEAVRTERFKYIRYPGLGPEFDELYDLEADPFELRNEIGSGALAETREALREELDRLLGLVSDVP